mgnify:FL=1
MHSVDFVYPNVTSLSQRGSLLTRWSLAQEAGCIYVEVPADMIKNKTEVERTGQEIGSFLSRSSIEELYEQDASVPRDLHYVLHTEPSVPRTDQYGLATQTPLRWHDDAWVTAFVNMIVEIQDFLGRPADVIEIHPGDRRNSYVDLGLAVSSIVEGHRNVFDTKPLVLLENRTGQIVSNGNGVAEMWHCIRDNFPEVACTFGIMCDLQQFYTVTGKNLLPALRQIPAESLRGFHIHHKHRCPSLSDPIPWAEVFEYIRDVEQPILINPEIHHANRVKDAVTFCKQMLG